MHCRTKNFFLSLALLLATCFSAQYSFAADAAKGEALFKTNCVACHKLGSVLIGPDLTGVKSRWKDEKLLHAFIHNSTEVIAKDAYAKSLFAKFNVVMPPQSLSEEEIGDVVEYVNGGGAPAGGGGATAAAGPAPVFTSVSNDGILGMSYPVSILVLAILLVILISLVFALMRVRNHVTHLARMKELGENAEDESVATGRTWGKKIGWLMKNTNPYFAVCTVIGLISIFFIFDWYHRAQDLGLQIGYAPEQPIKFSHKKHAGELKINCEYCHTGVEKSKSANIPSVNICMNCHKGVSEGPVYGKTEIQKIYDAYNNRKPVKWVRIHNLPDHVYFNHSQHVVAGKVNCDRCHGGIADMDRVSQSSTLEMGWCINCHRETAVNDKNPYYAETFDFIREHNRVKDEMKAKGGKMNFKDQKYTVAQMGGLECSKCHY